MTTIMPQCFICVHFDQEGVGTTCKAFPKGIPSEILLAEFDHSEPYPGDNGIRFEPEGGDAYRAPSELTDDDLDFEGLD